MRTDGNDLARTIVDALTLRGIEEFSRFYGVYKARVEDVRDEEQRGYVQISVPIMQHSSPISLWVQPSFFGVGDNRGMFWPPCEQDNVKVVFERGDSGVPTVYFGGFLGTEEVPAEFRYDSDGVPRKRGFISRMGNTIIFDDTKTDVNLTLKTNVVATDDEALTDETVSAVRSKSNQIRLHKDGINISTVDDEDFISIDTKDKKITVQSGEGPSIVLAKNSIKLAIDDDNFLELTNKGIILKTKGDIDISGNKLASATNKVTLGKTPIYSEVIGEILKTYLNSHTHIVAGVPSAPPTILATDIMFSKNISLSK